MTETLCTEFPFFCGPDMQPTIWVYLSLFFIFLPPFALALFWGGLTDQPWYKGALFSLVLCAVMMLIHRGILWIVTEPAALFILAFAVLFFSLVAVFRLFRMFYFRNRPEERIDYLDMIKEGARDSDVGMILETKGSHDTNPFPAPVGAKRNKDD